MKSYQLTFTQKIPVSLQETWDFFSSPMNLARITPAEMNFTVLSNPEHLEKMYPGMIINYMVSPLKGIRINWMTEITQVRKEEYFIDEQRFGPYKFWHHQHHFKEIDGGTEMNDILTYGLPMGIFGRMVNRLFVAGKLREIFNFREQKIQELFGAYPITGT
ncbi:SRPBCC family protein [Pedobacter heparinus]|uniref:SRPBCC family protein n=1 Tax=Pedobacter heparinus TaxID=984 RepID=UPI00292DFA5D|nr:SRPBCC family protein [Pedobacter heparinus]